MPGPQALRIQQQTTLTQSSYSSIRGAQLTLWSLLSFIHSHLGVVPMERSENEVTCKWAAP